MTNNTPASSTSVYYSAIIMNNLDSDQYSTKCASMAARRNGKTIRRNAFRFDKNTLRIEGNNNGSLIAPSPSWWLLSEAIETDETILLNIGTGTTSTVNIFKVYDYVMTDAEVNAFLTEVQGGSRQCTEN